MQSEGLVSLSGRRVLVTGGTAGIGLAICRHLLDVKAKVYTFSRHPEHIAKGRAALGDEIVGEADQARWEDLDRIVAEAVERLGGLDAVVVNAGIAASSVLNMEREAWLDTVRTNLVGPMHLSAVATPHLEAAGGGHLVFIGSLSAKTRSEGGDVYVATKSGLRGFVDSLGRGLGDRNINACLVEPGLVRSDMSASAHPNSEEEIAQGKMLQADDVARTVLYVLAQPPRVDIPLVQVRPRMQKI